MYTIDIQACSITFQSRGVRRYYKWKDQLPCTFNFFIETTKMHTCILKIDQTPPPPTNATCQI